MPFAIPAATLAYWRRRGTAPVTDAEIASLETRLGGKAPPSYVEFMKAFGSVEFDFDIDCQFAYVYDDEGRDERLTQVIGHIKKPARALRYYEGWQKDTEVSLPAHLLPFAMDLSQGELLIEFGRSTERIFYWDFDNHDWGSGVTRLGFVASDMYELIRSLTPYAG
jgi:hypothetical protein